MMNIGICDDFPVNCEVIEAAILQYGEKNNTTFNIRKFNSGEELIDLISKEDISFDLLFLDYCMKELTGLETAKKVRQLELAGCKSACSIVFVTSMDNTYELMSVGPLRVIRKPVNPVLINKILTRVLSGKERHGQNIHKPADILRRRR
ncbi:MAG: response regulator [Clostridiaceae bacterium]|jgi:CheY-like chemotaxis protein|nr:response regulator [Clostridiaceae bacterium]